MDGSKKHWTLTQETAVGLLFPLAVNIVSFNHCPTLINMVIIVTMTTNVPLPVMLQLVRSENANIYVVLEGLDKQHCLI